MKGNRSTDNEYLVNIIQLIIYIIDIRFYVNITNRLVAILYG